MESFFIVSSTSDAIEVNENIQTRNAPADIQTKRVNGQRVLRRAASVTRDLRSQDEQGRGAFADDEIALPMAGLAAAFNGFRTIMD